MLVNGFTAWIWSLLISDKVCYHTMYRRLLGSGRAASAMGRVARFDRTELPPAALLDDAAQFALVDGGRLVEGAGKGRRRGRRRFDGKPAVFLASPLKLLVAIDDASLLVRVRGGAQCVAHLDSLLAGEFGLSGCRRMEMAGGEKGRQQKGQADRASGRAAAEPRTRHGRGPAAGAI